MSKNSNNPLDPLKVVSLGLRKEFFVVLLFSCIANLLMLIPTIYLLQVFDRVMISQSETTLIVISSICFYLLVMMAFSEWSRSRLLARIASRLDAAVSTKIFDGICSYLSKGGGDIPSRIMGDFNKIRHFLTGNGAVAVLDLPWTPIYIAALFLLHPFLGYLSIAFVIFQTILAVLGHSRALYPSHQTLHSQLLETRFLQSKVSNAEVIQALGMTRSIMNRWQEQRANVLDLHRISQSLIHRLSGYSKFMRLTFQSLSLAAGAYLVIKGELTPGAMIAGNVLVTRSLAPIDLLTNSWRQFLEARESYHKLRKFLGAFTPKNGDVSNKRIITGQVVVSNLSLRISDKEVLRDINIVAAPGSITMIIGPSGSGKSTLGRAILGLYPDHQGQILIDGEPVESWSRSEIGPQLGYLPQEIELFDGTVAENISRFAKDESDMVLAAAKAAGLNELILKLPLGYDTPVGSLGSFLSGGQRQRIGIARAIYGDPKVIVLDEPNSNLDETGENALISMLYEMRQQFKTVFIISHRSRIMSVADQLIILKHGRIERMGPKDEIISSTSRSVLNIRN
jgi:ATP-binding cassette subfamily C exporter for protease/lipase